MLGPIGEKEPKGPWIAPMEDSILGNKHDPSLSHEGIQTRDLSDNAYTINQCGTTIVPIDIRILPDGDIEIKAMDPDYGTPGPDEAQKF